MCEAIKGRATQSKLVITRQRETEDGLKIKCCLKHSGEGNDGSAFQKKKMTQLLERVEYEGLPPVNVYVTAC